MNEERNAVIEAARKYYRKTQQPKEFDPGKTYIPASAKVLDEEDLAQLIEASLDLWLTAGRFAREFESSLPAYFGSSASALLVNSGSSASLVAISSLGAPMLESLGYARLNQVMKCLQ